MKKYFFMFLRAVAVLTAALTDNGRGSMYMHADEIFEWITQRD